LNQTDFANLGLVDPVLTAVRTEGYTVPTPIQAEAIPALLAGRDLLGIAQTGTGKTAAFALPIIQRFHASPKPRQSKACRALVVAPTRELAAQIEASFQAYGRGAGLVVACVFGGVGSTPQEKTLLKGVDVLIATPGRLLDLIDRGHLHLKAVESVVLDEADRMFDMGFIRDVRKIVALLPAVRQTIMFSATMPPEIEAFADPILTDPVRAAVPSPRPTADRVDQKVLFVAKDDKRHLLAAILKEDGFTRVIVFTKTKHGANRLVKQLAGDGIPADAIHANKSQNARTRTMASFRAGETAVLVATDLAARGIDVDDVELVVNYELPHEPETYIHRIGRTARAGAEGVAVSLCDAEERPLLRDIERLIGFRIPVELDHPYRLEIEPLRDAGPAKAKRPRSAAGFADRPRADRALSPRPPADRPQPGRFDRPPAGRAQPGSFDRPPRPARTEAPFRREAGPIERQPQSFDRPAGRRSGFGSNQGRRGIERVYPAGDQPSLAEMFAGVASPQRPGDPGIPDEASPGNEAYPGRPRTDRPFADRDRPDRGQGGQGGFGGFGGRGRPNRPFADRPNPDRPRFGHGRPDKAPGGAFKGGSSRPDLRSGDQRPGEQRPAGQVPAVPQGGGSAGEGAPGGDTRPRKRTHRAGKRFQKKLKPTPPDTK
jgi:ATP-dependent RNA helicase RhlE